jgi:hypothetical protein
VAFHIGYVGTNSAKRAWAKGAGRLLTPSSLIRPFATGGRLLTSSLPPSLTHLPQRPHQPFRYSPCLDHPGPSSAFFVCPLTVKLTCRIPVTRIEALLANGFCLQRSTSDSCPSSLRRTRLQTESSSLQLEPTCSGCCDERYRQSASSSCAFLRPRPLFRTSDCRPRGSRLLPTSLAATVAASRAYGYRQS